MEKITTIKRCADRIKRHPMMQDIPFETILDYLVDFLYILGCPQLFVEKVETLQVKDYKATLPCDFVSMIQVRTLLHKKPDDPKLAYNSSFISYRYATDSFHLSDDKRRVGLGGTDYTYKIQGNIIYTSTKDKPVEIVYKAIAVDDEGYPEVPDNPKFLRAFDAYVKKTWFTTLFDMGKVLPAVLQNAQQEYAWAVGACESDMHKLTLDKAESLYNIWNNLIIRANEHRHGFANAGAKEYITIQP